MRNNRFRVNEKHIKLLKNMYVTWNCSCFGAPTVEPKKPYGNSRVYEDMRKILDLGKNNEDGELNLSDKEVEELSELHHEMEIVLQILLYNCSIEPGVYINPGYSNKWILEK